MWVHSHSVKRVALSILFTLIVFYAHSRQITGRVLDGETQKPVRYANVILFGTTQGTVSNHLGFFSLEIKEEHTELVISSIGYQTSKTVIPSNDQFKILLTREYRYLPEFDLGYYVRTDLSTYGNLTEENRSTDVMEREASYPGGLVHFYNDLGLALKTEAFASHFTDSIVQLKFTVNQEGKYTDITSTSLMPELNATIATSIATLKAWNPALQNNFAVAQHFLIDVKWTKNPKEIFSLVEETARPANGYPGLYKMVGDQIKYPQEARRLGIEGKVYVEFIVNEDGSLSDLKVVKGIGGGCDGEALRIIALSPNWIPGKQRGVAVKQKMVIPITFSLGGNFSSRNVTSTSKNDIQNDFYKWVGGTIRYPSEARRMGIEGYVYVEIQINMETGEIIQTNLLKDIGAGCGNEVLRVLSSITPEAILILKPKKDKLILPVIFGLDAIPNQKTIPDFSQTEVELLKPVEVIAVGVERQKVVRGYSPLESFSPGTTTIKISETKAPNDQKSFEDFNKKATIISLVSKRITIIPPDIKYFVRLKSLDLENNLIEDVPDEIGEVKTLIEFFAPKNQIKNLPSTFAKLNQLEILGLAYNQFTEFPMAVTQLKKLQALDLAGNKIKSIPVEIGQLTNLVELYLQDNQIETITDLVTELKHLEKLYLSGNPLSESEKARIKQLMPKTEIQF